MRDGAKRKGDPALSRELDAWLAGDRSRRHVLAELLAAGGFVAAAALAGVPGAARAATRAGRFGPPTDLLLRHAAAELASPDTPLGKAQHDAVRASTEGPQEGSAYRAVQAAKKYKGQSITMTYEAGLQALEPTNFSGPLWQDLTGITSNVVGLSHPDQYSKPIAEHIAQSGAYDILDIEPAWIPSLADGGVIAPIDDLVAKHMNKADLDDYHPLYKFLPTYKGKRWGFFDDGDMFALYYRRDVFEDPKLQAAYKQKFNQDFRVPATWDEYDQVARFITDQLQPNVYGAAHFRKAGSPGNQFCFYQEYRANAGRFFDPKTMRSQLASPAGIATLQQMVSANKASIPGNNDLDAVAQWAAWLQGKVAMIFSWPPTGRMSENYAQRDKAINFIPSSSIGGKVGYAVVPGGAPEMASGYVKALTTDSRNPESAYLFMQWSTSPPVSLVRVMLPYTLRDPYRLSHYTSPIYRSLWPAAKEYLVNLSNSANVSVVDPVIPGAQDYALSIDRMCTAVWAGEEPKAALARAASEWDAVTDRIGADAQRAAYEQFLKLPGCYPDHTIAKLGMAVTLS
jgi:multiple sugar transport system substrate-binding protein